MRSLLAALVVVAVACSSAAADTIPQDEQIAVQTWGYFPCHGQVSVVWAPMPGVLGYSQWTDIDGDPHDFTNCTVTLSTSYTQTPQERCSTLVHEFGHLTGHAHSPDPTNVMYPELVRIFPPCMAVAPPKKHRKRRRHATSKGLRSGRLSRSRDGFWTLPLSPAQTFPE